MIASEWEMFCRIALDLEGIEKCAKESRASLDSMRADIARMADASEESNRMLTQFAKKPPWQEQPYWSHPIGPVRS